MIRLIWEAFLDLWRKSQSNPRTKKAWEEEVQKIYTERRHEFKFNGIDYNDPSNSSF